jgi:cell division protein ZapA (FtsZ GTPase activity inhibitor)
MENLISTNIVIADRSYRLKVDEAELATLQNITKLINDKIVEYKTQLAGKDMQDFVSMVLLWFATSQLKSTENILQSAEVERELTHIETLLDNVLSKD